MSRTAAIKRAKELARLAPTGRGQLVVIYPYRITDPEGPTTESQRRDYHAACADMRAIRAALALELMCSQLRGLGNHPVPASAYVDPTGEPGETIENLVLTAPVSIRKRLRSLS